MVEEDFGGGGVKVLSLFSGIGGLDLAAEWAGMKIVAMCEIEPYAIKVLERRFPNVPIFGDVATVTRNTLTKHGIEPDGIDCIIGGFPCQPFSVAGKRKGKADERFLWGEFNRLIGEIRPSWVVAENVPGLISIALDDILADLEGKGYGCLTFVYPASAVGAPHRRERVFIVAHRHKPGLQRWDDKKLCQCACELPVGQVCPLGKLWPTPDCSDRRSAKSKQQGLSNAVKGQNWPTPREFMYKDSTTDRNKSNIGEKVGGQLNPDWVEILMGFPVGWTDIDCEEPLPWPGWPALMGQPQYDYEPPRVATKSRNRTKRLKCLGNAVVPQQAYPIFQIIADIHRASLLFKVKTWED